MSRLEDLIQTLCPDGVEYKKLGDMGAFFGGLTGKTKQDFQDGNKKFISYMNVYKNPAVDTTTEDFVRIGAKERQNTIEYGDILFTGSSETPEECGISSVMVKHPDEPFYLNSFTIGFRLHDTSTYIPEFSKYLFRSAEMRKQINKTANGVTRFNVSKRKLAAVKVPLPPLPVQEEIVRILDTFTALEMELEAELAARTKQYEYYREILLNNTTHSSTTWKTLGEVSLLITKGTTPSSFETCGVSFVKTESFEGSTIIFNKLSYVSERVHNNELKRSILQEEDILFSIAGSIGKCVFVPKDILPANTNQALAIIRLKKDVNKKLIFYLLQSKRMTEYIIQNVKGSAQPNLNLQQMNNYPIPLPPLEVQEQIVSILDRFDTLVNDLKSGLPAEIALRRKQYEYYRDKLLTFKPLE